jgi:hypothetical protein
MKSNAQHSTEFENFDNAMRRVLHVSKEELQRRLEAEKQANAGKPKRGPKPKTSASDHVSSQKG